MFTYGMYTMGSSAHLHLHSHCFQKVNIQLEKKTFLNRKYEIIKMIASCINGGFGRTTKIHANVRICADSPKRSLLAYADEDPDQIKISSPTE